MDESITRHLNAGIPADQLVMGLAFYGNSGAGEQISLQQIQNKIASGEYADQWDDVAKVPYLTQNGKFAYGYDNARSLTIKCQYIIDHNLAGGMYWEYGDDDNMGTERNTVYDCLIGNAEALGIDPAPAPLRWEGNTGLQNDTLYDLQGRVIATPQRGGLYIWQGNLFVWR